MFHLSVPPVLIRWVGPEREGDNKNHVHLYVHKSTLHAKYSVFLESRKYVHRYVFLYSGLLCMSNQEFKHSCWAIFQTIHKVYPLLHTHSYLNVKGGGASF
jgi:hypothetical protein